MSTFYLLLNYVNFYDIIDMMFINKIHVVNTKIGGIKMIYTDYLVPEVLRIARIANDLKINQSAKLANISKGYLAEVEKGKKSISEKKLKPLLVVYHIEYEEILKISKQYKRFKNSTSDLKKYQETLLRVLVIISNR